ncbi:MAG TPA: nitroreductase family deazaflavin-dependent oxidoreductase [Acetobacteraceae bacterium]
MRLLFRVPVLFYRCRCGWLIGHRFLLLIQVGRRTGLRRRTVLEIIEYRKEGPEAVVMNAYGANSNWLRNIRATPNVEVVIGSKRLTVTYRFVDQWEAVGVLTRYQRRNRIIAPIMRSVLSHFLGWDYDGSEEHVRRLVAQLPLIAFRALP